MIAIPNGEVLSPAIGAMPDQAALPAPDSFAPSAFYQVNRAPPIRLFSEGRYSEVATRAWLRVGHDIVRLPE